MASKASVKGVILATPNKDKAMECSLAPSWGEISSTHGESALKSPKASISKVPLASVFTVLSIMLLGTRVWLPLCLAPLVLKMGTPVAELDKLNCVPLLPAFTVLTMK